VIHVPNSVIHVLGWNGEDLQGGNVSDRVCLRFFNTSEELNRRLAGFNFL
jgi:hypothetical protein